MTGAGQYPHKITFRRPVQTPDGIGGQTLTWTDVLTTWAAIWPLKTRENIEARQVEHEIVVQIHCRWRPGINATMRIYNHRRNKTYTIRGLHSFNEYNRTLMIEAVETD